MAERTESKETEYNYVTYRSRTEARWAVFFDELGITNEYEKERITLSNGQTYLPDFYLPEFNAYLEVKPNDDKIVTEESFKARKLSEDLNGSDTKVWLAMGGPTEQTANIIPLSDWDLSVPIDEILQVKENRYIFYQDRRDKGLYWLYAEDVYDSMRATFLVGGWGTETDHDRIPMMFDQVERAYKKAREYNFD
jgi:hypothetical protein